MRARVLRPRGVRKASRVNDALRCCLPPWGTASALRSKRLSRLNGRPARAPVNAPAMPLRTPQYDSGSVWFAIPSPYGSLIHYSSPAYRRFPPTLRPADSVCAATPPVSEALFPLQHNTGRRTGHPAFAPAGWNPALRGGGRIYPSVRKKGSGAEAGHRRDRPQHRSKA